MELLLWLAEIEIWRLQRKDKDMFGKPKDEKPSLEDYDLNAINELHSRTKDFRAVGDYRAARWSVIQREHRTEQAEMDVEWDQHTDSFRRRR